MSNKLKLIGLFTTNRDGRVARRRRPRQPQLAMRRSP